MWSSICCVYMQVGLGELSGIEAMNNAELLEGFARSCLLVQMEGGKPSNLPGKELRATNFTQIRVINPSYLDGFLDLWKAFAGTTFRTQNDVGSSQR